MNKFGTERRSNHWMDGGSTEDRVHRPAPNHYAVSPLRDKNLKYSMRQRIPDLQSND